MAAPAVARSLAKQVQQESSSSSNSRERETARVKEWSNSE